MRSILRSSVAHGRIRSIDASAALRAARRPCGHHRGRTSGAVPDHHHAAGVAAGIRALPAAGHCPRKSPLRRRARRGGGGRQRGARRGRARRDRARHRAAAGGREPSRVARRYRACCSRSAAAIWSARSPRCAATPMPRSRTPPTCAASASRCSASPRCRWSRAACSPNGTRRAGISRCHGAAKVAFHNRGMLAKQMGLAEDAITMIESDVGGGFGVRGEFYPEDFLIPFAARRLGRPVKWIEDRREHLLATNHARDAECELEIACDRDGTIRGLRGQRRGRSRRLYPHQRRYRGAQHRAGAVGPVSHPAHPFRHRSAAHQQDAVRHLSRAGPLRGGFLPRAAVRHRGARARHRPGRIPPPQSDLARPRCRGSSPR